ncbi:probable inactive receptor kinase at4g23740 [Phtheirospermum japonicum]|uniref:Probable inactive receptor kinase at4g23740 n=1 Tax=Phtheirospermum japonicum TaxID=374723 RepID=A0A830BQF1_9LAMI|nr:probable inactive receptor kinase at4g23740 [Phtheirospermum japonicum]
MSANYDNWERLVGAVLKKQQLWQLFHDHSRSPSLLSEASDFNSSFNSSFPFHDQTVDFARLGSLSRSHRAPPKLVLISDFRPIIDVKDVYLASAELLGRGTFGTAYAAQMANGVKIVVKRLNSMGISENEFNRHMEIVGDVKHENVAALRAYYSSEDQRLMLYEYYSTGSVYALLHGQTEAFVSWETRLKIAIGAAKGIAKIHSQNGGTLVHGNIKASNIFLNSQEYGCVSDLGVSNMMIIKTKVMPAAHCYAPEVKKTKNVSQASDVYSFGILLLELLTRKPTVHIPGGPEAVDLVKLVKSVKNRENNASEVFDAHLLKHPTFKEQMIKMLQIGIRCVEKSIKKRPKMWEVVSVLEEIIIIVLKRVTDARVPEKLVFIEDAYAAFDLKDVLRASAEVLGEGTFGTCYIAQLENGNTVVVKRLRDVVDKFEDFRQHMEIIGSIRHGNVGNIRAYFYSKDEKLLVYDYYEQDSVSALLHGKIGNDRTPLDWETRLKIVLGAARGIARIHKQDRGKLVHGNIKSSNIFLDRQKYGIVSDIGLARLVGPNGVRTSGGYSAPEVIYEKEGVSQACDVYSFGVVMLEILFRQRSQIVMDEGKVILLVNWVQFVVRDEWTTDVFDAELVGKVETVVQVLQIAMDCIRFVPERRPLMSQVVRMLEDISGIEPTDEPSVESRLEGVLENMLSTLTPF